MKDERPHVKASFFARNKETCLHARLAMMPFQLCGLERVARLHFSCRRFRTSYAH